MISVIVVAAASLCAWFVLMQHSRYLITSLPLLCIIAAAGAEHASREWKFGKWFAYGLIAVTVFGTMCAGVGLANVNFRPAIGLQTKDDFLTENLDCYEAEQYINKNLPSNARVILFDEVRGFYLDRDYIWGNPNHHEMIPWASFKTGVEMVKWLKDDGYTHLLWNRYISRDSIDDIHGKLFPEAIGRGLMRELYSSDTCTVYEFGE